MLAKEKIFREYDIRGVVDSDFDAGMAHMLGRAFAKLALAQSGVSDRPLTIAVGRDCRLTGEQLQSALIKGLLEGGVNVLNSGMGPTPQLYYTVLSRNVDGGIQVTGSHNPADQNGFKMMIGKTTLSGDYIQDLKRIMYAIAEDTSYIADRL